MRKNIIIECFLRREGSLHYPYAFFRLLSTSREIFTNSAKRKNGHMIKSDGIIEEETAIF